FKRNRTFYLHYTPAEGEARTRIAEWAWPKDTQPKEVRVLLETPQPYPNHNGGQILFGPDGYLYVGLGDGGWANDPHGHGQNAKTLLGSILRIGVEPGSAKPYTIPPDNPYASGKDGAPEAYATGMRNPWKFAFDAKG